MKKLIPLAIAANQIDRARMQMHIDALHLVHQEAIAMLIVHLHRAGAVDGPGMLQALHQAMGAPEAVQESGLLPQQVAGMLKDRVHQYLDAAP